MEQYIADKQVMTVLILDQKTPAGLEMVEVIFTDETKETMPKKRFEMVVSEDKTDASAVQKKITDGVGSIIYSTIVEYGVKWGEVNAVGDKMIEFVNNGFEKASDVLWKTDKPNISLIDINSVLIKDHVKDEQNNDGSASTGSGTDSEDTK